MGRSPSIEDLQAKDEQFRQYLNTLEQDLNKKAATAAEQMRSEIEAFYSSNKYDDAKAFVAGKSVDFVHEKEFSLNNLKNVIDQISAAVFSGAQPPKGVSTNKDAVEAANKDLGRTVGAMANLELYIAGKVFDVLSNIVLGFGTGTSVAYTSSTKTESLGFGMQMFTSVATSTYESHSFFVNEYISQYLYMYDVRFSIKQAQTEAAIGLVQTYENLLADYEERLNKLGEMLAEEKITLEDFKSICATLQGLIDQFHDKLGRLKSADRQARIEAAIGKAQGRRQRKA
ncbi:hypothetical protein [Nonomuraea diastatica]|uniref:Uncharacterized protein n=1 Tax=Nonomuraea diastatica TaxID=1848329 RepID=A0A4R4WPK7_9ACTN|nr:hypothetical protein [Nonomuraea diastatica]TDD18295.1 hypothetical protein E1294_24790 [Nonomuraea diastatica]